ncbi:FecR family protein [Sphingobacterium faecale]|uniref:FecR domain-containing protein n=1 Tax=Sphingobacterium faecale TaxID=2803775 RepID=A0ABS1RA38_9SPHI|nr:FecR domain-containing protein [Sphingobacterium faecale]MBL1411558.1 FecR domain-containing protein [Sphingobacterium faecale]
MNDLRLEELFDKYIHNRCSGEELEELLDLLQNLEGTILERHMHALWENKRGYPVPDGEVDWRKMLDQVKSESAQTPKNRINTGWFRYTAVATLLLSLSIGGYFWLTEWGRHNNDLVENTVPIIKRDTVLLSDGTQIVLNSGSTLRYPKQFVGGTREVHLDGEGFFDVAKDPDKPFIVYAGELKTIVLGTSFNVNAYSGQSKAEVTVITGQVHVEETKTGRQVDLIANEKVIHTRKQDQFVKSVDVKVEHDVAWNAGRQTFEDVPLDDIVQQYYRRYGKRLKIEGTALYNCRLSLVFDQESPGEVLEMIRLLTNAQVRAEGDVSILYGTGCPE